MKKIDCTVIGDAMVDVSLPVPQVSGLSQSRGDVISTQYSLSPGGAANVAVMLSNLQGKAAFVGKVGDDNWGKLFMEDLKANQVITNVSVSKTRRTGMVFCLVSPDGERLFIVDRGANAELGFKDIDFDLLRNSSFLYFNGFSFQDRKVGEAILKAVKEAANSGTAVAFSPGAPNLAEEFSSLFVEIMGKYVDILILNRAEGQCLTKKLTDDAIIHCLLSSKVKKIALTIGVEGSMVAADGVVHTVEASTASVIDTTGAGDAYAAGFIYGLTKGKNEVEAAKLASQLAARVVSQMGARITLES